MKLSRNAGHRPGSRALSAGKCFRQAQAIVLALLMAGPLAAAPDGDLETIPIGDYICELPGDATGPAGLRVPAEDFTVVTASSYRAGDSMGSYLLAGDMLTMTGGPLQGKRYKRQSEGFVRLLDANGNPGDLRCIRRKRNNS